MLNQLVLASGSQYKKQILEKLNLSFVTCNPNIDENTLDQESPYSAAKRLAILKAKAAVTMTTGELYLGLDQVVSLDTAIIGKPLTKEKAVEQLLAFSGKKVTFFTGICLLNAKTMNYQANVDVAYAYFRELTLAEITAYVDKDLPLDCAGSFKSEGLGISLLTSLSAKDPNSVVGLPLIELISMLKNENYNVLV